MIVSKGEYSLRLILNIQIKITKHFKVLSCINCLLLRMFRILRLAHSICRYACMKTIRIYNISIGKGVEVVSFPWWKKINK